jgi:hypothetical protein
VVHTAKLLGGNYLQISNGIHISITCVPRQVSVCSPWECWNVMVSIYGISVQCIVTSSDLFWSTLVRYGTLNSLPSFLSVQVEHIQRRATKVICPSLSYSQSLTELELPTLFDWRESLCKCFYRNNLNTTSKLFDLLPKPVHHQYNFRNARKIPLFKSRTKRFSDSFLPYCVKKWDAIQGE